MTGAIAAATSRPLPAPGDGAIALAAATISGAGIVGFGLEADGDIGNRIDDVVSDVGDWISPKIGMSHYEAQATLVSATDQIPVVLGSNVAEWLPLNLDREWKLSGDVAANYVFTIEIRRASTHELVGSATITLETTG